MADAMSAHVFGAAAAYYNPAGLSAPGSGAQVLVMHQEWVEQIRMEHLGVRAPLGEEDAFGVTLMTVTIPDIEVRTRPGPADGTFTARNFELGGSYARKMSDQLSLGITAKFLHEKIFLDEASGFALDAGMRYATPIEGLNAALTLSNIGGMSSLRSSSTKLPASTRIGFSYAASIQDFSLLGATDIVYVFPDARASMGLGAEIVFENVVAGRAGYLFGSDTRSISAGIGVRYEIVDVDYAFSPLGSDLGSTHTVSIIVNF